MLGWSISRSLPTRSKVSNMSGDAVEVHDVSRAASAASARIPCRPVRSCLRASHQRKTASTTTEEE